MSAVADKLREARALIERGWTQGANARNAAGVDLDEIDLERDDDSTPVCWCAGGAMFSSKRSLNYSVVASVFRMANEIEEIPDWNDDPERTQADVLAAFDKAIALAEQSDRSELLNQVQR